MRIKFWKSLVYFPYNSNGLQCFYDVEFVSKHTLLKYDVFVKTLFSLYFHLINLILVFGNLSIFILICPKNRYFFGYMSLDMIGKSKRHVEDRVNNHHWLWDHCQGGTERGTVWESGLRVGPIA